MSNKSLVTMSKLGSWGRFANQIFQYAFLRIYAKENDLDFQTSEWIGQYLFGHYDPPVTKSLPLINDNINTYDWNSSPIVGTSNPPKNVDIIGYFQYHTSCYVRYRRFFRSLYKPTSEVENIVKRTIDELKRRGNTIIGFHLRRGDYGSFSRDNAKCFFIAPCEWYLNWLNENWARFDKPVLFIASDEIHKVKSDFAKYNPVTNQDLGVELLKAPFYPDFYVLCYCNILCISNSSFSFVASMLNEECKEFFRPRLSLKKLIPYDPWNSHTVFRDEGY